MRQRPVVFLFALLLLAASSPSQTRLHIDSLYAPSIGRTRTLQVLLPVDYDSSRRYPVLYLLHGLYGSPTDWTSRTGVLTYAEPYSLIIVFPDGENSWYVNSLTDPSAKYEDYIMRDIIGWINARYMIDTARQAIAGLSMGGYGAVYLAMRYPRSFVFAGSLSGAISMPGGLIEQLRAGETGVGMDSRVKAFGKSPGKFFEDHDPLKIYRNSLPDSLTYFYLVAGIHDGTKAYYTAHRALTDSLKASGIRYEYHEVPGEHNWIFWDREIRPLLRRLNEILQK